MDTIHQLYRVFFLKFYIKFQTISTISVFAILKLSYEYKNVYRSWKQLNTTA